MSVVSVPAPPVQQVPAPAPAPSVKHGWNGNQTVSRCPRCRTVRWKSGVRGVVYSVTGEAPWYATPPSECEIVVTAPDPSTPSDWIGREIVLVDVETTGLEPTVNRVIEVAAVRCVLTEESGHFEIVLHDVFSTLVHPEVPVTDEIKRITGIGSSDVEKAPKFAEIAGDFLGMFPGARAVVAYNGNFDKEFLNAECVRAGRAPPHQFSHREASILDPMVWGRWKAKGYGKGANKLGAMAERLRVEMPKGALHRADVDALLAGRVLCALAQHIPRKLADALDLQFILRSEQDADFYRFRMRKRAEEAEAAAERAAEKAAEQVAQASAEPRMI